MNSQRLNLAFRRACQWHEPQLRKGTDIPYLSHLLGVCSIVLEHGGSEAEAIAALLHDAAEDQGGRPTLELIEREFGSEVADIVAGCTDIFHGPSRRWRERKQAHIRYLHRQAGASVRLVSAADKLHNARAVLMDYRTHGEALWQRFTGGGRSGTLWYYRTLADVFLDVGPVTVAAVLDDVVARLETVTADPQTVR